MVASPVGLRLVDELIEARLDTKVTIQELAAALGLSAGFFSRAFKAAVGKAPHDYIVDCRISRARRLLESTELDLTTIAQASGFASHAHMTTTFRNRLGINPGALRRRRIDKAQPPCGTDRFASAHDGGACSERIVR
jgi:AraC family transcriptional regulator